MSHFIASLHPVDAGLSDFKECLRKLRQEKLDEALLHARRAVGGAPKNPFYLSYAGLLAALAEQRFDDAEMLCLEALGMRDDHPQIYLNLAEVYENARRPTEAIEVLEKALASAGRDFRVRHAREKLGRRRKPVFSFLPRSHRLNRILGRWRHRLMGPVQFGL